MLAARMHGYKQPLVLEDIRVPEITPDQVVVRLGGAGMRRSDDIIGRAVIVFEVPWNGSGASSAKN